MRMHETEKVSHFGQVCFFGFFVFICEKPTSEEKEGMYGAGFRKDCIWGNCNR